MDGMHYTSFTAEEREVVAQRWLRRSAAWNWIVDPVFLGHEHVVAGGPALWVGNHSLMAFADGSLMLRELYLKHGIVMRSLGLHAHFKVPVWGDQLTKLGAVDGTRENCAAMMQAGEHILVYPGGGGEVMKRQGEQYTLRWKNRTGFARMAIENNCPIVPFATIGADECWDIVYDNNRFSKTRLGQWMAKTTGLKAEELPPLLKGIGPTLLPKPQRMYFKFFPPVDPAQFAHLPIEEGAWAMRREVQAIVEGGMTELLAYRERDSKRSFRKRLISRF